MDEQLEMDVGKPDITVAQLDEQVDRLAMLKSKHTALKDDASAAHKQLKEQEERLLLMLEACDKKSYKVDGLGTITRKDSYSVTTPKTLDAKKDFFKWVQGAYGDDGMWSYASVNSATLNRLYNECRDAAEDRGEDFTMDGIDLPTTRTTLSFRRN